MTLRTLNYGNYGIFLIMGNAGFCPSTVAQGLALSFWLTALSFRRMAGAGCFVVSGLALMEGFSFFACGLELKG